MKKLWLSLIVVLLGVMKTYAMDFDFDDMEYRRHKYYKQAFVARVQELLAQGATGAQLDAPISFGQHGDKEAPLCRLSYYPQSEYISMVEQLLKAGANPNVKKGEALENAISQGSDAMVGLLLKYGADVHSPSRISFAYCLSHSFDAKIAKARLLLQYGARVNGHNGDGLTPLNKVLIHGDKNITPRIKLLLVNGADPFIRINVAHYWSHGKNVIDLARHKGYEKLAHYLEIAPALRRNVLCAVLQQVAEAQCGRFIEKEMIEEILAWLVVAENQAPLKKGA